MKQSLAEIFAPSQTDYSHSLSIVMGILLAGIGIWLIIWHRKISIAVWKSTVRYYDRVLPGIFDKGWRIMDLRTPEKSWWVTLWGYILIVGGIVLLLAAYANIFGPIYL